MIIWGMASYTENRKARFNYEILEKYEAGIELLGTEVKSVRNSQISLEGAFVIVRGGEAFLINANIPPFQPKNAPKDYDPLRNRKLLLTKKEIRFLIGKQKEKGFSIIPLEIYLKNSFIKIKIGIGRGKKKYDKREALKKRDFERKKQRLVAI